MKTQVKYKTGDIVKLKSGGPDMTIKELVKMSEIYNGDKSVNYRCQWFAGKKLDVGLFPEDSLLPVSDEDA